MSVLHRSIITSKVIPMIAFKVSLNGNRVCVAGDEDMAVLTAGVTAVGELGKKTVRPDSDEKSQYIGYRVGGMTGRHDPEKDVFVNWVSGAPLQMGDVIQIKVFETDKVDRAKSRKNAARYLRARE